MNGGQLLQSALLDPLSYIGSHYPDVRKCRSGINNPRPVGSPGLKWSYTQNLMKYAVLKNYEQMRPFSEQMRPFYWLFMMLHCFTVLFCISIVINIYMQLIYAKKTTYFSRLAEDANFQFSRLDISAHIQNFMAKLQN